MRRSGIRLLCLFLSVLMLAGVASGCGAPASEPVKKTVQKQKVLRMAESHDIATIDPPLVGNNPDYEYVMNVFNGLVRYKPGTTEIEPDLATKWDISPDGLTYTFYLRKGVKFHKGYGELTAEDVKFTFERIKDPQLKSPFQSEVKRITEVKVIDPYTVQLKLDAPYADLLQAVLAYRPGYIVSQKAVTALKDKPGHNPIGTGPYMFESHTPNQGLVFLANPDYFKGRPKIDKVTVTIIPETTIAVMAMGKGDIDFMPIEDPAAFRLAQADPKLGYIATPGSRQCLWPNMKRPFLNDVRVRRALSHAINREELIKSVAQGSGSLVNIWSILEDYIFGSTSDVASYPYDPARAKQLLAQAGATNLRTSIQYRADDRWVAEAVQGYWNAIGVRTTIEELEPAAFAARRSALNFDWMISGMSRVAPEQLLVGLRSNAVPMFYGQIDALIDAQRVEVDPQKRIKILQEIQKKTAEFLPNTVVYRQVRVTAFRKGVTGAVPNSHSWLYYWDLMDVPE